MNLYLNTFDVLRAIFIFCILSSIFPLKLTKESWIKAINFISSRAVGIRELKQASCYSMCIAKIYPIIQFDISLLN